MHATRKVKLKDISPNLTCHLCGGYFIDATTIVECIHSFCRSCIVRHLERCDYCPVCEVQLHSSKPLSSIRSDAMLQEIVYKLVPGLFQNEMTKRRDFYKEHSESKPRTQLDGGQVFNESYITSDDMIHLSLEFDTTDKELRESTKRYILCPAAVSISVLKKLIQGKYDLTSSSCIEIMYKEKYLPEDFLLMDIAYKYSWSQNGSGPLQLNYRILSVPSATPFQVMSTQHQALSQNYFDSIPTSNFVKTELSPLKINTSKVTSVSKSTPTGKPRGRPKRKFSEDTPEVVKKPKLAKEKKSSKKSKVTNVKEEDGLLDTEMTSQGTEVQLRISENGVMSAKSVASGEELIITPLSPSKGPSPPMQFNGTFSDHGLTNGRHRSPTPFDFSSLPEQNSPISLTKKTENGNHEARKVKYIGFEKNQGKTDLKGSPPHAHHMLKVPTPTKWLQSSPLNGSSVTPKSSSVKDSLKLSTNKDKPPTPKKPPKFFKSRISESMVSNGHSISQDFKFSNPEALNKADPKGPSPQRSQITENGNEKSNQKIKADRQEMSERMKSVGTNSSISESMSTSSVSESKAISMSECKAIPDSESVAESNYIQPEQQHHHALSHHQFQYGLHLDDNMNMGTMGGLPMHYVPSLSNGYCQFPFFTSPTPGINPLLAMAMSMNLNNLNPSFAPFYANPISTSPNTILNGSQSTSQKHSKGNGNFLDLSMPSKKSKSGLVQISPKKSYGKTDKEKAEGKTVSVSSACNSSPAKLSQSPLSRKQATPTKAPSAVVPPIPDVPVEASPSKGQKTVRARQISSDRKSLEIQSSAETNQSLNFEIETAENPKINSPKIEQHTDAETVAPVAAYDTPEKGEESKAAPPPPASVSAAEASISYSSPDKTNNDVKEDDVEVGGANPPTVVAPPTAIGEPFEAEDDTAQKPTEVPLPSTKSPTLLNNNNNILSNDSDSQSAAAMNLITSSSIITKTTSSA